MSYIFRMLMGPQLYRIYSSLNQESTVYSSNVFEKCGDKGIQIVKIIWNIGIYASPFLMLYLWKKEGSFTNVCVVFTKCTCGLGIIMMISLLIRLFGRLPNVTYNKFLSDLNNAQTFKGDSYRRIIQQYDFDFSHWPSDFSSENGVGIERKLNTDSSRSVQGIVTLPCYAISWFFAHFFGRHLMYPGSVQLLQLALDQYLQDGRTKLIQNHKGKRSKVMTKDGNYIDTLFIDRRKSDFVNGPTLVVCCEGNAGFYEIGIMTTPIEAGYSVLGWNHPGFAGSSGTPFPSQEQHAVDAVMQFAIHKLNFLPDDIIIFAWSIGGYSGTWAAMNYPEIQGLILDATFDDVLPLAIPRMPSWMTGLVKATVRNHLNLNNAKHICKYLGPLTIVRRTKDEIITTEELNLSTNRGNDLLVKVLKCRYPHLFCSSSEAALWKRLSVEKDNAKDSSLQFDIDYCTALLNAYFDQYGNHFPVLIGEDLSEEDKTHLVLFLTDKYLVDFNSNHNAPLDTRYFRRPWKYV